MLVGQTLPRKYQRGWPVAALNGRFPCHCRFHRVAGAPGLHIRRTAQSRELLHRLVGGSVFTQAYRVMGKYKDGLLLHQRRHAHRIAGIFHEHQEGRAVVDKAAVQSYSIHHGRHTEFTHAVVKIIAAGVVPADGLRTAPDGQVGSRQVSGAAQQLRQQRAKCVETVLGGLARGDRRPLLLALLYVGGSVS